VSFKPEQPRDERGRWTDGGGSGSLAHTVLDDAAHDLAPGLIGEVKGGGFSHRLSIKQRPTKGFMVSRHPKEKLTLPISVDTPEAEAVAKVEEWLHRAIPEVLKRENTYLGGWLDTDTKPHTMWFDVSDNVTTSRKHAVEMGRHQNQKAIWDVENGASIDSGGSGL
jgi:hypothetical protein